MSTQSKTPSAEWQAAHIGGNAGLARRLVQEQQRKIHAQGSNPPAAQRLGVTSGTAGEIQDRARLPIREDLDDKVDMRLRLALVPV